MLAEAAIAAALVFGNGPLNQGIDVLAPASLRVERALPRNVTQVDVAPDGHRLAVAEQTPIGRPYRSFLEVLDGTETTARVKVELLHRVVSWLADDRIMLVQRSKPVRVQVIAPSRDAVIHTETVTERFGDTARVGDRQVLLSSPARGGLQTLRVFSADGALERMVALDGVRGGALHGRSPVTGHALILSDAGIDDVDVATGAVTRHPLPAGGAHRWLEPPEPGALLVESRAGVTRLDPVTFAAVKSVEVRGVLRGAGTGFLTSDTEGDHPFAAYDGDLRRLWRRRADLLSAIAFGDRVYAGSGYDDVKIRVYDLQTGKKLRTIKGRAYLFAASAGRVEPPYFSNQAITED